MKRKIAITGASGTMGRAAVEEFASHNDTFSLRLLLRDKKKNRKLVKRWQHLMPDIEIVWGDLLDKSSVVALIEGADVCLHLGGLVSPQADWLPEMTMKVNIGSVTNIVESIRNLNQQDTTRLVYIGSVAQYGPRAIPFQWGGAGDPMMPADFDKYALSKICAERIVAESGLRYWVSLRQSGILDPSLLFKGSDPISFHVPLNGVLEWATVEDSARLMIAVSRENVPESVWRDFHDIGSGVNFRLTNYEFETLLLKAISCPAPEKIFEPDWFATRNFHGIWYLRSDRLNSLLPFRENVTAEDYFRRMASKLPSYFRLTALVPPIMIKFFMKRVALNRELGTLGWLTNHNSERLRTHFHPAEKQSDWTQAIEPAPTERSLLNGGLHICFNRMKNPGELTGEELAGVASSRGGCLLNTLPPETPIGDMAWQQMEWECGRKHRFSATPATVASGGHWCPECGYESKRANLEVDSLLRSAWLSTHSHEELNH